MDKDNKKQEKRPVSLKGRVIRLSIVLILYLAFLYWLRSWLGLIVVPFIVDAYITKWIPWTWWKRSKNPMLRTVMGWVDAIVFALVAVYFVNIYFFQNYQIPSSSLEKSLLVGDYLFVSKMSYGARIPNTPLSMPLTQHTMPLLNTKSYIENPQWAYRRAAGCGEPKRGDIVVFNFPAGDTVALGYQDMDIYSLAYAVSGQSGAAAMPPQMDSLSTLQQRAYFGTLYQSGMHHIRTMPQVFGKVITRPVDRRENYVKRCVAVPGDNLQIKKGEIYINGKKQPMPREAQFAYSLYTEGVLSDALREELQISLEDAMNYNPQESRYVLPLTQQAVNKLRKMKPFVRNVIRLTDSDEQGKVYPQNMHHKWGRDNYGPIHLPKKGETIAITLENLPIYERCITAYEGNTLAVKDGRIFINGKEAKTYTFKMGYYWMMGDNRHNSLDSRYWGFVPEDHIVGKPIVVWLSLDKDKGLFEGKIRWNRFFKFVSDIN